MIVRPISLVRIRSFFLVLSLIVLSVGTGFWYGRRSITTDFSKLPPKVEIINRAQPPEHRTVDFSLFWQVWDELAGSYITPDSLDPEKMVFGAISGMTSAIGDPYTVFLPPMENKQTKENLSGKFGGVGIQLGFRDRALSVVAPLSGMPAERAGIKAGDFILHIKDEGAGVDKDTQGMPLPEAVNLIRGKLGTKVLLTLIREGQTKPFDVELVREEIVIPSIELTWLPPDEAARKLVTKETEIPVGEKVVAHLAVAQFGDQTDGEWDRAVSDILDRESDVVGIVLDFRNNPGGYLSGAIRMASEFLSEGTVVVQQGRVRSETFPVEEPGRLTDLPFVVLVNGGSASASEIVAGALRDRRGAVLVGEKTFGKGTVQEARDLPGGAGLHVTTSKWILPSGEAINAKGLTPNIEVTLTEEENGIDEQLEKAIETLLKQQ
ncbi:MAG: hypothetical protein A2900_04660 [Candidatus Chisholmbacteria bacterium RIFCSPLOWO2_01_FULL_50_28]|uniref:PDZ domain-containing protein n=1 Tax=Candidatus Chisholmbacteria bacterium RIFCSPHIGHO2_01_FULL_52_32 TaxID=1797591 RepID=A0A1G1VSB8_9BACT|nr:MAG: hypothetical protein A2786_02085 [Candidatus Chisholmbacteria bacterium RIFCSPHIGHO2_01_FULL_52_32]OGY20338.1 MAG: hypothetical protein A2900_04660 [Candidatus Chisholmbacteria bacterium RIFCSPLOWO2_01_FULL_50_28]